MSTETHHAAQLDLQAICEAIAQGKALDPILVCRVEERAERVRKKIHQRQGLLDVAVDLIRETREE